MFLYKSRSRQSNRKYCSFYVHWDNDQTTQWDRSGKILLLPSSSWPQCVTSETLSSGDFPDVENCSHQSAVTVHLCRRFIVFLALYARLWNSTPDVFLWKKSIAVYKWIFSLLDTWLSSLGDLSSSSSGKWVCTYMSAVSIYNYCHWHSVHYQLVSAGMQRWKCDWHKNEAVLAFHTNPTFFTICDSTYSRRCFTVRLDLYFLQSGESPCQLPAEGGNNADSLAWAVLLWGSALRPLTGRKLVVVCFPGVQLMPALHLITICT